MTATSSLLEQLSASLAAVTAAAAPSLVAVHSPRARSSGFVWRPGLVVIAEEPLAEEGEIAVVLAGGRRVAATIAGRDPTTDVALLRADTADAPAAAIEAAAPAAGALALALGSREGSAVAALGIVAAAGPAWRSMRGGDIDARIELDLALRRHAEGGLALDAAGRAFGMAVLGPRRRALVIPGATVARAAALLEAHGRIPRGTVGLGLQPVRLDGGGMGAMVMSVEAGGPAAAAGVRQGDIVTAWDGRPIRGLDAIARALGPASIGRSVTLGLSRGGEARELVVTVGAKP